MALQPAIDTFDSRRVGVALHPSRLTVAQAAAALDTNAGAFTRLAFQIGLPQDETGRYRPVDIDQLAELISPTDY